MGWRWTRTAEEMAADFARGRQTQTDEQFLTDCGLANHPEASRTALAVRRSVAGYGMVAPEFIRASDRYPEELTNLSGWESIDMLGWILELERELGEPVEERVALRVSVLGRWSVRDLVWAVHGWRVERGRA